MEIIQCNTNDKKLITVFEKNFNQLSNEALIDQKILYSGGHLRWAISIEIVPKKKLTLDGHHCTLILTRKFC